MNTENNEFETRTKKCTTCKKEFSPIDMPHQPRYFVAEASSTENRCLLCQVEFRINEATRKHNEKNKPNIGRIGPWGSF